MDVKRMAKIAVVAAIYWALTVYLAPISYGEVQFRVSEILLLLCFYRAEYAISLIIGCFLANLSSPMAALDLVYGTSQTVVSVLFIIWVSKWKTPRLWVASLGALIGCPLIGYELYLAFDLPIVAATLWVMLGEFVVVTILGVPVFMLLEKRKKFMEII